MMTQECSRCPRNSIIHVKAAVDVDGLAGDVAALRAAQQMNQRGNFVDDSDTVFAWQVLAPGGTTQAQGHEGMGHNV